MQPFLDVLIFFISFFLFFIDEDDEKEQIFQIREFFPSMKYFFHEDWQLEMVAKCCPFIEKMLFIFHEDCVQDYLVLNPFENLNNLELFGGKFYSDKICELIQIKGSKLSKLTLLSIKEIDFKAFAILSLHGKNLTHLNINNCEIVGKISKKMSIITIFGQKHFKGAVHKRRHQSVGDS